MATRSYEQEIVSRLKKLPNQARMHVFGGVSYDEVTYPFYALELRKEENHKPWVLLSAGTHGNEVASVHALLNFIERDVSAYEDTFNFLVLPCLNPAGFERNTRQNPNSVDLNRNFLSETPEQEVREVKMYLENLKKHFLVAIDIHEDPVDEAVPGYDLAENPQGFYLYESAPESTHMGYDLTKALRDQGITTADNETIYGDKSKNGVIEYSITDVGGTFNDYLVRTHITPRTFVLETPTIWPLAKRVETHMIALSFILEHILNA